jgi:tetratricopeptide (TPR) repeat protein
MGKPEQAKPILSDLVKDYPNNMPALDSLFRVSMNLKDVSTAKSAADGIVATRPKLAVGYLYEGMLAEEAKRNEDALRLYRQAIDLQPDGMEPVQAEVHLLVELKRTPEAMKRLDELIAKYPETAAAPNIKGELLVLQKDAQGAQAAFKMAIARVPGWWPPYRNLAAVQFATNDQNGAFATLRAAQSSASQPEQASIEIASYLERAGKPQEAIREYDDIVHKDPASDVAANNLAMLLVTYGKDAASLDRAKSLAVRFADSSNPNFLDTYGWVLFKHGEAAASVPILERVVSKVPDAPVALYHLGMAQSQSGSGTQALDNLTRAVNSGAKFTGLDEAKATLDKLKSDGAAKT